MKLLVINPGSTSTKVSLFEDETELLQESEFHDAPLLLQYPTVNDQVPFRTEVVRKLLAMHGYTPEDADVFVGRGGSAHPQTSGVMPIDERLWKDTYDAVGGSEHAAKLGVLIAWELGKGTGKPMYTMNPTNVDELCDYARLTGIKGIYRTAQCHALNQKGVGEVYARQQGKRYEDMNLIIAHIDGGITVHAHDHGKMVDGNVGSAGDGAFTPTRIGSVPVAPLLDYIEQHSLQEVRLMCYRSGGFVQYFGTSDVKVVRAGIEAGDKKSILIWDTMIYQVCKYIGAMAAVLNGKVDGILLTGGFARYEDLIEKITERVSWIAPIAVFPGEVEQEALAYGALKVLRGEDTAHPYTGEPVWQGFDYL